MLLTETIAEMKKVESSVVPRLLPYLEAGLAPAASAEQYAGALMVGVQLSVSASLALPLTEALLEGVAKGARAPLHAQALQALLAICGSQRIRDLPSRAFKHLVKMPDLPSRVADMCGKYQAESLVVPLVRALAQSATQHANYERVLGGVVNEVKLSDLAVRALVQELVTLGSGSGVDSAAATPAGAEHGREVAARSIRMVDVKHPLACSAAVDHVLGEAARRMATKDGEGNEEGKAAADFLREALAGSAAGPLPGHAASLGAALDHPQAGLREAALRELRNSGAASKVMSGGARKSSNAPPAPGIISGALLRRVTDDVPRIASLAAALPGLRVAVGDDEALFAAAVERLRVASAHFVGKNETAELERGVAKRLVKLACGTLALPFPRAKDGEGVEVDREESDSEAEESDSEADPDDKPAVEDVRGALGNLAGRAAGLALGHAVFSPATRAVARATIAAAKRNLHPSLAELRTDAFDEALAKAQDAAGAASPEPAKGKKGKKASTEATKAEDTAALKEARARSDAAANTVVIGAVAKGIAAGVDAWGEGELTLWALEAWRDGSPGARANLLLAMRDAVAMDADGSVREALWAVLRDSWTEGGAADFSEGAAEENLEEPVTAEVARAIARNNPRVTPPLARAALHRLMQTINGKRNGKKTVGVPSSGASAGVLDEAFARMSIADGAAGKGAFAASFDALLGAVERGGGSSVGFLATRAASDPGGDPGGSTEIPRTALELLATRGGQTGVESQKINSSVLAVLTVACTASKPAVRAAAANAIVALAPKGAGSKKAPPTHAVWRCLKDAAADVGSVTKSVDAGAALCDALAAGFAAAGSKDESDVALREILAPLASLGISDGVGFSGGDAIEPRLGAYGGRRLVAALKGVGSDASKAEALAPALRWCLSRGEGEGDAAELAVEIIETFTVDYAKSISGATSGESWRVFASALVAPSPAPARVAAICRATPDFVDSLPAARRGELLRVLFTAVGTDADAGARAAARDAIDALKLLADDIVSLVRAAAAAATTTAASPSTKRSKVSAQKAGRDADGFDAVAAAVAALEVVGWKSPGDVVSRADLAGPCQELLASLLDAAAAAAARDSSRGAEFGRDSDDEDVAPSPGGLAASGYSQAVVLSTLDMLARDAMGPDSAPFNKSPGKRQKSSNAGYDVRLIVRAVTEAEAGPAREAALALLAAVAKNDAVGVMEHVLEVSAALARRASNATDDPLAQRALEQALAAVVPAWIEGGFGVKAAAEQVVNALPDAPEHRRAPLCLALLRACPEGEGLPVVLLLLLGQLRKLEEAAAASAAKRAKKAAKAAEKAGVRVAEAIAEFEQDNTFAESAAWVLDLAALLLSRETASGAVDALVATMKVSISPRLGCFFPVLVYAPLKGARLADDKFLILCQDSDALLLVEHRVEKTSAAFLLRDEPAGFITRTRHIFPTRNRAADPIQTISPQGAVDEGGRIVWLSAEVTSKHLSSRAFLQAARRETAAAVASVEKNAEGQDEEDVIAEAEAAAAVIAARLQEGYADLAECALLLLQAGTTAGAEESPKAKAKGKSSKHAGGLQPVDTKAAARMERGGRQVLTALDGLLAPGPYLRSLAPLLEHEDGRVRRKALRLIAHRLHAAAAADVAPANKYEKRKGEKARDARSRARAKDRKWKRSGKATTATTEDEDAEAEEMEEERADEAEAGVALIEKLAELAGSGSYATRSAALAALDAASSRFAGVKDAHKPIIDAAPAAVESLSCSSRAVVAAGAGCIASIVKSQGVRCVGILPNAVPKLLETANSAASSLAKAKDAAARAAAEAEEAGDEAAEEAASEAAGVRDDEAAVLVAALKAVDTLMEQLSAFVSPYLPEMLRLLLSPALVPAVGGDDGEDAFDRESSAYHAAQSAAALREIVARRIPHRLLLKPLAEAYDSCLAAGGVGGAAAARSALGMAAVAASTEPPAPAHRGALVALLLRALDVRREPPAGRCPAAAVDEVEAAAVQAFVTFSLQLTESSFVPVFTQVVEWAKARAADAPAARTRLGALFRLASSLADALRAVFVPLATPLLDLAAAALDPVSDPAPSKKKKKKKSNAGAGVDPAAIVAELDTWRMRTHALSALRRLFVHDGGEALLDANRFNQLHPLVTRMLRAIPPSEGPDGEQPTPEAAEGEHMAPGGLASECVACVAAMIASAPDDALWKPAHRGVLLATREGVARTRLVALAALGAVVDKLQEEYLALLPEAIPFLSELFEDPDEAVEGAARAFTGRLTELSGEDLKSLMLGNDK